MNQETIEYIKEHIDVHPRRKLAQNAGICTSTLYRILHKLGSESGQYAFTPKPNKECEAQIAELYYNHTKKEIMSILKCDASTISKAVLRLHLVHSQETLKRTRAKQNANLMQGHEKKAIQKRTKSRQRLRTLEKFRLCSGLPQKTKYKFRTMPVKHYMAKYRLIREHDYFAFENEPYIIGYDSDTNRANEQYYIEKYGFNFERFDEELWQIEE